MPVFELIDPGAGDSGDGGELCLGHVFGSSCVLD